MPWQVHDQRKPVGAAQPQQPSSDKYYYDQLHFFHVVPGPGRTALLTLNFKLLRCTASAYSERAQCGTGCGMPHRLETAEWTDGKATAGYLSSRGQGQCASAGKVILSRAGLGETILDALDRINCFISAALPLKVVPPLFNRYVGGQSMAGTSTGAVRPVLGTPHRVRTDLSATLFSLGARGLRRRRACDRGEIRIAADQASGRRYDSFLLRNERPPRRAGHARRAHGGVLLGAEHGGGRMPSAISCFEIDTALQQLGRELPKHPALVRIAGAYHNLLRTWSDT